MFNKNNTNRVIFMGRQKYNYKNQNKTKQKTIEYTSCGEYCNIDG